MRSSILFSIAFCVSMTAAQAQNLRDRARREGGKATTVIGLDLPVMRTAELLSQSALVMQARIVEVRTRLGPDESYVVTDYVVAPTRVIKQNRPLATARPGETTEIVVRRPGGRLIEDGIEMITGVNIYPESESFKVGEDVVVFLEYDTGARVYRLTGGPFGAFRVQGGRVRPMTEETSKRRADTPKDVTAFVDELVRASR